MHASEREPVLDLLERAFDERDLFALYMDADPAYDPEDFILALDGGRPVSCVQIVRKTIRLRGQSVPLGGIGSVATDPDQRGKGLASELMRRSEQRMRERGMPLGLLFTGRFSFYAPLGWVQIPAHQIAVHRAGAPPAHPGIERRALQPGDLPEVRALYERHARDLQGTTVRDEAYWQGQLRYASAPGDGFRVARRAGRVIAYARGLTLTMRFTMEYAHAPGKAESAAALMLELCPDQGAMISRLPPDTAVEAALRAGAQRVDRLDDPTQMWRALDPPALARLAGLPETTPEPELLRELIAGPPVHYWMSDRF